MDCWPDPYGLIEKTKPPQRTCTKSSSADPRIVSAEQKSVVAVPLPVVAADHFLGRLLTCDRLPRRCRPASGHETPPSRDRNRRPRAAIETKSSARWNASVGLPVIEAMQPDAPGGKEFLAAVAREGCGSAPSARRSISPNSIELGPTASVAPAPAPGRSQAPAPRARSVPAGPRPRAARWNSARSLPSWRSGADRGRRPAASSG